MNAEIEPFNIRVSDDFLADLQTRLGYARYPHELNLPKGEEWSYGTPVSEVKDLVEYWKSGFDWRTWEAELNAKLPQFTTLVDTGDSVHGSMKIHFAHRKSSRPNAIPLLFVHGWPGHFAEVMKMADELVEPADPKHPAFHLVAPSIPGYGFSEPPSAPGIGVKRTAAVFDHLMRRLGYGRYLAQGGDWGASVVRSLAIWHQDSCKGVLSNMLVVDKSLVLWHPMTMLYMDKTLILRHPIIMLKLALGYLGAPGGYSSVEMDSLRKTARHQEVGLAYEIIQKQRPQTLGIALTDSPVGLLAWILEKLHSWVADYPWTKDEILLFVMLNWIPGPAPSLRYYKENLEPSCEGENIQTVLTRWSPTPLGVSIFKSDIWQFPDDFGSMVQPLKYVKRHDRGGHFAAWEAPDLLLDDIREFTKIIVEKDSSIIARE
ncbi:hypothetical protein FRB94_000210 [Tulasnella sp. JGI-2019a]|nr:hypothetical protein FRB94_000210 [Tulasnella sp. JGI-2019a]KAG9015332.1 hypothetical protein FRB93_013032 [Tulasnella sp. JGI-2019a]